MDPRATPVTRAFWAGVGGAALVTVIGILARIVGIPINLEHMVGSVVTGGPAAGTWVVGLVFHLALGGLLGVAYGWALRGFPRRDWRLGMMLGGAHALASGLLLGFVSILRPLFPELAPTLGLSWAEYGPLHGWAAAAIFVLMHLVFGTFVGQSLAHRPSRRS